MFLIGAHSERFAIDVILNSLDIRNKNSSNETNAKAAVNNVPSQLRNCAVPPDHLRNEISFSRTRKNLNLTAKNH